MAVSWKLVQAFIREATEDVNYAVISDPAIAYAKIRAIQRGFFTIASTGDGMVQILSRIGETEFRFAVAGELSTAGIIEIAETALEIMNGKTVAQMRAMLVRRKTTRVDFSTYDPS